VNLVGDAHALASIGKTGDAITKLRTSRSRSTSCSRRGG